MRKYRAINDRKISGKAGPVIKATGIKKVNVENTITWNGIERSKRKDLKGASMELNIVIDIYTIKRG